MFCTSRCYMLVMFSIYSRNLNSKTYLVILNMKININTVYVSKAFRCCKKIWCCYSKYTVFRSSYISICSGLLLHHSVTCVYVSSLLPTGKESSQLSCLVHRLKFGKCVHRVVFNSHSPCSYRWSYMSNIWVTDRGAQKLQDRTKGQQAERRMKSEVSEGHDSTKVMKGESGGRRWRHEGDMKGGQEVRRCQEMRGGEERKQKMRVEGNPSSIHGSLQSVWKYPQTMMSSVRDAAMLSPRL